MRSAYCPGSHGIVSVALRRSGGGTGYPANVEITSDQSATDQARNSVKKYAVWTLGAGAVIVHLLVAARSVGPMYVYDEVGYLAGANVFSGNGIDWSLCGSSYSVGYSVLLPRCGGFTCSPS